MLIDGQVLSPENQPIAGAAIYVVSAPVRMPDTAQLTDDMGRFIMSVPVPGRYIFGARTDEWGAMEVSVQVSKEKTPVEIKFTKRSK